MSTDSNFNEEVKQARALGAVGLPQWSPMEPKNFVTEATVGARLKFLQKVTEKTANFIVVCVSGGEA